MKRLPALALLALVFPSSSIAGFYSYFQWRDMTYDRRAGYIAGILDLYVEFDNFRRQSDYWQKCITAKSLTDMQIAVAVVDYAAATPREQAKDMPLIVFDYLFELCGVVPPP